MILPVHRLNGELGSTCEATMNFHQQLSAYKLGLLTDKDLPDIAIAGIEEGYDSGSLRILAGRGRTENAFVLCEDFQKALHELGFNLKDDKDAFLDLLVYYAEDIVNNGADPYEGYKNIIDLSYEGLDHLDFDLLDVYTLHVSIWEEESDGLDFHSSKGLTKEEYIESAKQEMITHLKTWLFRYRNKSIRNKA